MAIGFVLYDDFFLRSIYKDNETIRSKKKYSKKNKYTRIYYLFKGTLLPCITYHQIHKLHLPHAYQINKGLNNIFSNTPPTNIVQQ